MTLNFNRGQRVATIRTLAAAIDTFLSFPYSNEASELVIPSGARGSARSEGPAFASAFTTLHRPAPPSAARREEPALSAAKGMKLDLPKNYSLDGLERRRASSRRMRCRATKEATSPNKPIPPNAIRTSRDTGASPLDQHRYNKQQYSERHKEQ